MSFAVHSQLPSVVDVIIVARNQASNLGATLAAIPLRLVRSVVVVDNGSRDSTASVARDAGAVVLREPRVGDGAAYLRAIAHLQSLPRPPDVVVLMRPDGSDHPEDIPGLLGPICSDNAELVISVRHEQHRSRPQDRAVLGLINTIYRHRFDDVGDFRAIRFPALVALSLTDRGGALGVEMLVKAIKLGLHIAEVPVGSGRSHKRTSLKRIARELETKGRELFHILRHSTTR